MAKITVIGSFVMDNVAKMRAFPQAGQTILGDSLERFPGGKGANQCVAASRLGGDVEMIGMLGRDENAEIFRKILKEEGIVSERVFSCDKPTAVAQVQINAEGQNRICVIPSANYAFGEEELKEIDDVLKNTELVVLQLEMRLEIIEKIVRTAHAYGTKIMLNPAPAVKLSEEILSKIDYITPNETELSILTGMPTDSTEEAVAAAQRLISMGTNVVVATLGSRGALLAESGYSEVVDGFKVQVVDTVAAGDSFNGALAVAITEGKNLKEAVRFANAMGALTVQKNGAIPSLHTREELDAFIKNHSV